MSWVAAVALALVVPFGSTTALAQEVDSGEPPTTTTSSPAGDTSTTTTTTAPDDPTTTTTTTAPGSTTTTTTTSTAPGGTAATTAPDGSVSSDPSTILVKLVRGLDDAQQAAVIARNGGVEREVIAPLRLHVIEVPSSDLAGILASYAADPDVAETSVDTTRTAGSAATDPGYASQWALPRIGWEDVHGAATLSGNVKLAVLDTGVAAVADLAGRLGAGWSAFDADPTVDDNGHGTHLATIAAATADDAYGIAGVAYSNVTILPVQVLGADGTGADSDIIAGLVWAVDHGADVVLMGFSNPGYSAALQDAIDYAWNNGAVLVAAAGNDGASEPTYPAGSAKVVGVGATDADDALWAGSNQSAAVFLGAPGVDVTAGSPDGGTASVTGTSASAALVAGSAALLRAVDGDASNGTIVGRLARNADPLVGAALGNGRVNVGRAATDTSTDEVVPEGAPGGGPVVGPYVVAASITGVTPPAPQNEGHAGTSTMTFTITMGGNATPITVYYRTQGGTAVGGTSCGPGIDYISVNDSRSQGNTNFTVNVTICGDTDVEADETIVLQASNNSGFAGPPPGTNTLVSSTGTIRNDDNTVTLGAPADGPELNAGTTTRTFTVTVGPAPSGFAVTVPYTRSGTADDGNNAQNCTNKDYYDSTAGATSSGGSVTIPSGCTTANITLNVCGDTTVEVDETITVTLGTPTNAILGSPTAGTTSILNDDNAFTVNSMSANETNAGTTTFNFTVTLTPAIGSGNTATVTATTGDGTATGSTSCTPGTDYVTKSQLLSFTGSTTTQTFGVTVCGDGTPEPDETFTVTLSNPTNAILGSPFVGTGTIRNDDNVVSIAAPADGFEGNAGTTMRSFTVQLDQAPSGFDVTVPYTLGGTATVGNNACSGDYYDSTLPAGSVTIPSGSTSASIDLNICGDTSVEIDETIVVTLGAPTNAILGSPASGTTKILNDDNVFTVDSVTQVEGTGGTTTFDFTVTLTPALSLPPNQAMVTTATTGGGTATGGAACDPGVDYLTRTQSLSFSGSQTTRTFSVTVCGDADFEQDETFSVMLSSPTNAMLGDPYVGTGTIVNDDGADLSVTKTDSADPVIAGDAAGFDYTITVTNNGPSDNSGGFTVSDVLPAGTTFDASGSDSRCSAVGQSVTCVNSTGLVALADDVFVVHVTVASSVPDGTVLENMASVASDGTVDQDNTNDTSEAVETTVIAEADLSVTKTDSADPVIAGDAAGFDYTITVTNNGPSDNSGGFTVSDVLPAGTTFEVSGSDSRCSAVGQSVTCVNSTGLVALADDVFVVHVTVASSVPDGTVLENTASVASDGTVDPDNTNDTSAVVYTDVIARADLSVTKTDDPDPVILGGAVTYTITVTNHGPSDAQDVELEDVLPASLSGAEYCMGASCAPSTTWSSPLSLGTLVAEGSVVVTIRATVPSICSSLACLTLTNTATVTSTTQQPAASGENDTSTATTALNYDWNGFFRPVDNPSMLNVAKAGSAIPVKFSLAGNQGLGIMASSYPKSRKIDCSSYSDMDSVETTVTAGGSSLSYDMLADQYVYVWKSDKSWAGTCRELQVMLIDGTTHTALFKFTK